MPLFVAVVRYGALSRYRCVPAEDERRSLRETKRYADEFAAAVYVAKHFRPECHKHDDRSFGAGRPVFGTNADRADYTECQHTRFWRS